MRYLPIFFDTQNLRVLIAGGGEVALAKLKILLKTDAEILVFSTQIEDEFLEMNQSGKILLERRRIQASDIHRGDLVYCTYHGTALNAEIAALARAKGAMVNVVDTPELCDFISPAIVDRDPVVVAIGTEGTAPMLGRNIKRHLEDLLSPQTGLTARVAEGFRPRVEALPFGRARREFWGRYFEHSPQTEGEARALLERLFEEQSHEASKPGFVSFVGAGPGDPELLTLKARKAIDRADIIIHDRLVSAEVLELARREARLIDVGKKGFGPSVTQDEIQALIVKEAKQGALVVRLKGGDPSIFGRLDEEIEAVAQSDIAFEIIPGITAASASAVSLKRSLTSRHRNSELRFLTAHDVEGFSEQDWHKLSKPDTVAAIYMGLRAAKFLQGRLLMHGGHPDTAVSVIENASRANERVITSTLGRFAQTLEQSALEGPALIMLGLAPRSTVPCADEIIDIHEPLEAEVNYAQTI